MGGFYCIPVEVQRKVFAQIGRERYIRLPKPGTNPRGVEISAEAFEQLLQDEQTSSISLEWRRVKVDFNPYKRWVDLWKEE